jgi:para-nitrobenzyl esterase
VNYRLGVFGYLSLPGLKGSGNFGLADQILATRWARQNAAAFGGDPDNVTVFGESSGAMSACALLTSPAAKGLVDKVAMSSGGSCRLNWPDNGLVLSAPAQTPYISLAKGEKLGVSEARKVGCSGTDAVGCLRGKTTKDLLRISGQFFDVLAYGTPLLPRDPAKAVLTSQTLAVPVLSSVNRHEARAFVGAEQKTGPVFTNKTYPGYVAAAYPGHETELLRQYPSEKYASPPLAWSALITDGSWACPTLTGDTALAKSGSPVFAAEFADPGAPDVNRIGSATFAPEAAHGSDLPYLFDLAGKNALKGKAQAGLAATMIDYWSSFARSGTPTAPDAPDWPAFTAAGGPTLSLRPGDIASIDFGAEHHCAFWAALGS